jgi:hypothetical protein
MDYLIIFDGGSKRNGAPDAEAYGSYQLSVAGKQEIKRLQFPEDQAGAPTSPTRPRSGDHRSLQAGRVCVAATGRERSGAGTLNLAPELLPLPPHLLCQPPNAAARRISSK